MTEAETQLLELARRTPSVLLRAILQPHKVALLALEHEAVRAAREAAQGSTVAREMLRGVRAEIRAVREVAIRLATNHVRTEMQALGFSLPAFTRPDTAFVNQLMRDLTAAYADPTVSRAERVRRAGLAAATAANRLYTETQLAAYDAAAVAYPNRVFEKVWVANLAAGTPPCADCMRLHNTILGLDTEFHPYGDARRAPMPVYGDLLGPPRHPHCRCRLVVRVRRP